MPANQFSGKPFTFETSHGQPKVQIDEHLLDAGETISAREGYSAQESRFLKYLASKGHIGGTA